MSLITSAKRLLDNLPVFQDRGLQLARAIHTTVLRGGTPARRLADALHGTWLGHPLHAVMTDVVVGAWVTGALFDVLALSGERRAQWAGDALAALGTAAAVPTALAGVADYSAAPMPAAGAATLHGALNNVNVVLYALSLRERRHGRHGAGLALSLTALGLATASAWIGGHLVYDHKMGVDHSPEIEDEGWQPVLAEEALPERRPTRARYGETPVVLYRESGRLFALAATCAHAGGPLDEGEVEGCEEGRCTIRCPWHDSIFDLRTGAIVHGPTVHPQPAFDARLREGQVELRPQATA